MKTLKFRYSNIINIFTRIYSVISSSSVVFILGGWILVMTTLSISAAHLTGTIVDPDGNPISGVALSVRFNHDETTDTIYYTNFEGKYDIIVNDGFNEFRFSKEGYNDLAFTNNITRDYIDDVMQMTINEEENAKMLKEVEVTANMLKNFTSRTEMYLTKENREFGINALDAISSLPLFRSSINTKELTNLAGTSINILINGRRATPDEIRNLSGNNIKKVIYYENPPAKFSAFFGGPVINVLLNTVTRVEFNGNLHAEVNNSWGGSGDVGANMLMPEHYLNGRFGIMGTHHDNISKNQTFSYPGLTNCFETNDASSRRLSTNSFLSYQWDRGPHMLFANFTYRSSTSRSDTPMEILEIGETSEIHGSRHTGSHQIRDLMNIDLYYTYQFKGGQELSFDLVNAYNKATSSGYDIQTMEEGSAYGDFRNDISISNSVYNLGASAMFSSPFWEGSFSCSLAENYRRLSQKYTNNFFPDLPSQIRNHASTMYIDADYDRSFGKFGTQLSLSVFWDALSLSEGGNHNQVKFYPRLALSYSVTDNIFLSAMGWVQSSQNSIGAMNLNRFFIDTRYFGENLPYEKAIFKYCAMFSPRISIPSCKLIIMPGVTYKYTRHPYAEYVFAEGDYFIKRSLTIPFSQDLDYSLGLSWRPVAGLDVSPYFSGKHIAYSTPIAPVRFNWCNFRFDINYVKGNCQVTANCTSPTKSMDGVLTNHTGWSASVFGLWKKGSWYIGASYSFMENAGWTITEIPGFSHSQSWTQNRQGWIISAMVGYSFKAGKEVRSRRKNKRLSVPVNEVGF